MNALSSLVDILIAAYILHGIGWIDISLQEPIFYRGGNHAIQRGTQEMEGIGEGFQGTLAPEGPDNVISESLPFETQEPMEGQW